MEPVERSGAMPPRPFAESWTKVGAAVAAIAFLPFARGLLSGSCFYFRDLVVTFFPFRLFALDGLRAGDVRFWSAYTHEGEPLPMPALSYPLELLQLLWP